MNEISSSFESSDDVRLQLCQDYPKARRREGRPRRRVRLARRSHPAADIARAAVTIVPALLASTDPEDRFGTFHHRPAGVTSWHGIATVLAAVVAQKRLGNWVIRPIGTAAYAAAARRPLNSRLLTEKIQKRHGIKPSRLARCPSVRCSPSLSVRGQQQMPCNRTR